MPRSRIVPGDGDPRHGTFNGYTNLACRCPACRGAAAAFQHRGQMRRQLELATSDVEHGTPSTYTNHRCRCQPCRDAHNAARWPERHAQGGQ